MEERMIDDEYGRGIKLRKTKDGYVDVTDAEVEGGKILAVISTNVLTGKKTRFKGKLFADCSGEFTISFY